MRGKGGSIKAVFAVVGITPAYAGKREIANDYQLGNKDHPRLCGEKSNAPFRAFGIKGSPPPMRGKANGSPLIKCTQRITPAYAGKSFQAVFSKGNAGDHPRLCGEKQTRNNSFCQHMGSPPPMRGKD